MVSDTRSTRKSRDDSVMQSPGNTGKALISPQATETPPSVRKSKRLETPPSTPPLKRVSERLGKFNTPDSLRRSGRGKKELSSCSASKESTEETLSKLKKKKEKTVIQVTMESEKAELDPEFVGMKRKNLSARKFKALFKKQRIGPDGGHELERSENLVDVCSDNGSGVNSQPMEDTDYVGDDPASKYSTYCSSNLNKDSESSREGSTSGNCSKRSLYDEVAEDTASASLVSDYCNLEGTCLLCSKSKRVRYDSPEQELCSCCPMGKDLFGVADSYTDGSEDLCGLCNTDGDLLTCEGKNCRNCYHLSCLDPPLTDALPGAWHCPQCVKKKLLLGVHSITQEVESIWDVREVVVPNAEGVQQRQFLVKYRGLAHVYNHWVPEKQLLLETPSLVSNFLEKDQDVRWNAKWMVPHRLLWKRPIQDIIYVASTSVIWVCEYEWLVKWRDLDYYHATWELDNANFLSSALGQDLVRNYESRRGKANPEANKHHTETIIGHSEIPGGSHETHVLENVNKLRKFLLKCPNAVVIDDQERTTTAIHLIHSMIETFRPFLIIATHDSLSRWEANFEQLAPSVDVVVYSGSTDTRNMIRVSEFYNEGGCMIVQVLLSSVEAVLEDLEILKSIKWKAIVIDEYEYSGILEGLERIKMLSTDMRILLVRDQIKDATSEYLKILSLVEPQGDFDRLRSLKSTNDNLSKLKERLSPFIVHGHTSQAPKFIEYWLPVQLSNLQLEHYCSTLLSSSNALCSYSKKDPFCSLPEVLLRVRKCCHHPYLVDPSVQACLIADKHPIDVVKDVGIKASGKLQLLDAMLSEIKTQGLRVLILYQLIGSGQLTSGSILHDFLFHRFSIDKYEHVDAACIKSEKQAAADRFNKKTTGQFVFLLENRACTSCIKLSSLDIVVIYDSDWNPANDLKALKKISIDSKVEGIKVLRLYSSFTIEERALLLAKQNLSLDHNPANFTRSTNNTLLSWGATYLFSRLDEYHADSNSSLALDLSGKLLLDEVTKEFQAILSENFRNTDSNSVISEAKSDVGSYCTSNLVFGESKVQLGDGEEHHVFWKNLFEGKNPPWKHLTGLSPRNRKKVHYWEGSVNISETEQDNMTRKRQKMVNESLGPGSYQVESSATKLTQVTVSNKGPSAIKSCHQAESFHRDGQSSLDGVSASGASTERHVPSDEQQSTHGVLQRGMKTLCRHLNLPDNVIQVAEKFLEYVIRNHHVNSNSTSIVEALQISLCWAAASITDQKVNKKESLVLAKQDLGYQCSEEEVSSVYTKMRSLKKVYLAESKKKVYVETDNSTCLNQDSLLGDEDFSRGPSNVNNGELQCSSYIEKGAEREIGESSANKEHAEHQILTQQKVALNDEAGASEVDIVDEIQIVQKKCDKRMQKLIQKQREQIEEVSQSWKCERDKVEMDYKLESAVVRSIHGQTPAGMDKLKLLDVDFNNKIKNHDILKDAELKCLRDEHLAVINEERKRATDWLAKVKSRSRELRVINGHQSLSTQLADDAGGPLPSTHITSDGDGGKFPIPGQIENGNSHMSSSQQGNNVIPSISSGSAPADATDEHPLVPETVPSEIVWNNPSQEESNEVRKTSISDNSVCRRSGPEVAASGCVHRAGQPSLHAEQTAILPDSWPQYRSDKHLGSAELQDTYSLHRENRSDPQIDIAMSEATDSAMPAPSNFESPVTDDILTPEASDKAPVELQDTDALHEENQSAPQIDIGISEPTTPSLPVTDDIVIPEASDKAPAELQATDALHEENRSAPQIEIAMSEPTDSVAPVAPGFESPVADDTVTPEASDKAPVDEVFGQLHSLAVDISLSSRQLHSPEHHDQERSSPRTAEQESEVVHQSISQAEENLELHRNRTTVVASTSNQPNQVVMENGVAVHQATVRTSGQPNQAVLNPPAVGMNAGNLHGPGFLLNQTHQLVWSSASPSLCDPLQNEIERIQKETDQLGKSHVDMMTQLKLDCEKEIEEITAKIRKKYEVKFQETEVEVRVKMNGLDNCRKKVFLNKMLASAFRSKCLDNRPSVLPSIKQGISISTRSPSVRPSPRPSSASQPAPFPSSAPAAAAAPSPAPAPAPAHRTHTLPTTSPAVQQLSRSHSMRSSPLAIRNVTGHPIQGLQRAAAHISGNSARPPLISAITPANLRASSEIRSTLPHLQSCRPIVGASMSAPPPSSSASQLNSLQMLPKPPSQPGLLQRPPLIAQNNGIGAPPGFADRHPYLSENRNASVPDIPATFRSLEQSDLEMLGNASLGMQTPAVEVEKGVLCLSDDD